MIGLYFRVSTGKQEDGWSLDTQRDSGIEYAKKNNLSYKTYVDIKSGESIKRLDEIKNDIRKKIIDSIWVINSDRLSRLPLIESINFREFLLNNSITVIERDKPLDLGNFLIYGIKAVVDYSFLIKLRENTKEGKEKQRNSGYQTYGNLYGYNPKAIGVYKGDKVLREWEINPEKAEVIKKIFDYCVNEKLGLAEICRRLNKQGYKSQNNKNFEPSAISRIIKRIEYSGFSFNTSKDIIKSNIYKPIIDLDLWKKAQNLYEPIITNNSRRGRNANHVMTYIVYCGICNAPFQYHYSYSYYKWKNNPNKKTYRERNIYYHRNTCRCINKRKCFDMNVLDYIGVQLYFKAMFEKSESIINDLEKQININSDENEISISNINNELIDLNKQVYNFENAIAQGLNMNSAISNINKRKNQIYELEKNLKEIELKEEENIKERNKIMAEFSVARVNEFLLGSAIEKRNFLKRIIKSCITIDGIIGCKLIDNRKYSFNYEKELDDFKYAIKLISKLEIKHNLDLKTLINSNNYSLVKNVKLKIDNENIEHLYNQILESKDDDIISKKQENNQTTIFDDSMIKLHEFLYLIDLYSKIKKNLTEI